MTEEWLHNRDDAGGAQFIAPDANAVCDGRNKLRPSRVVYAAQRGVTLVELLVSMLILTLVCIAWMQIIGIQSARKEARRREAVERLSGMMDAFLYCHKAGAAVGGYAMTTNGNAILSFRSCSTNEVPPIFDGDESPIGYQLCVLARTMDLPNGNMFRNWDNAADLQVCRWLVGRLYNRNGTIADVGRPFFSLPVCLMLEDDY